MGFQMSKIEKRLVTKIPKKYPRQEGIELREGDAGSYSFIK